MRLIELSPSGNILILPEHQWSSNGWFQRGNVDIRWGKSVTIGDQFVLDEGQALVEQLQTAHNTKGRSLSLYYQLQKAGASESAVAPPPHDSEIKGIAVVLYTYPPGIRSHPLVVVQRELEDKPWFGKQRGDGSLPAESRGENEALVDTTVRLFDEELSLDPRIARDVVSIGYYSIPGEGNRYKDRRTWIRGIAARIPWETILGHNLHPDRRYAHEVDSAALMPTLAAIGGLRWRAGMPLILAHWLSGRRNVVAEGSPPIREPHVIYQWDDGRESEGFNFVEDDGSWRAVPVN